MPSRNAYLPTKALLCLGVAAMTAAGCSGVETSSPPPEEVQITGEPVSIDSELAGICEELVAQALPIDAAVAIAEASGYPHIVIETGENPGASPGGLILTSADGVVVGCTPG